MKYVDRSLLPEPDILSGFEADEFNRKVTVFLGERRQFERAPQPPPSLIQKALEPLAILFDSRCAFCEQRLTSDYPTVEHFRPLSDAEDPELGVAFQYYCWLGLKWDNLYYSCMGCSKAKRNRFPVVRRGRIYDSIEQLRNTEEAYLIDPCFDRPEEHLTVNDDGHLIAITGRGLETIGIFDLNRFELVKARKHIFELIRVLIAKCKESSDHVANQHLLDLLQGLPEMEGISRLILLRYLPENSSLTHKMLGPLSAADIDAFIDAIGSATARPISTEVELYPTHVSDIVSRGRIKSVHIQNFRGIKDVQVNIPEGGGSPTRESAVAILGENGQGKTCLLQAIALGSMGPVHAKKHIKDARKCLSQGETSGKVVVEFWGTDKKNWISFTRNSKDFAGARQIEVTVLGYGAYRRSARRVSRRGRRRYFSRVETLFNRDALVDGVKGLSKSLSVRSDPLPQRLGDAARTITTVLGGETIARISKNGKSIEIGSEGNFQTIDTLSSGFESIVAMTADILDVMYSIWRAAAYSEPLILIDELDAHLHPTWRLRITSALRAAFPAAQFIITTHDPLILRGFEDSEIRVLAKDENGISISSPSVSSVDGLSVDELLLSDLFSLESTRDPNIDSLFEKYYALLAKSELRNPESALRLSVSIPDAEKEIERQISAIEEKLANYGLFGKSRRDRLLYSLIDRYLAIRRRDGRWTAAAAEELAHIFKPNPHSED